MTHSPISPRFAAPRRDFRLLPAFLLLSALTACGERDRGSAAQDPQEPVAGGTAVVALSGEPDNLNPLLFASSVAGMIYSEMHDGMTDVGEDLTYQPRVARAWQVSADSLTVTYNLRPWTWSDGAALTARDFVVSFDLFKDARVASPRRGLYREVLRAEAPDDSTVRYHLSRPQPDPIQRTWHYVLPAHVVARLDPAEVGTWDYNQDPLVSGEFVLERWDHNRTLVLVPNPHHPEPRAWLDRVVFRIIPEQAARLVALETGEVDLVDGLRPDSARRLEGNQDLRVVATGGRRFYYLLWNFDNPVFADRRLRLALDAAIDRERMVSTLLQGYGQVAVGPIPPVMWNHHGDLPPPGHDPERARRLLADAGWVDGDRDGIREREGRRLSFEILTRQGDPVRENGSVILRENLADVGVDVTLRVMEHASGLARLRAGQFDSYFGLLNANLHGDLSGVVRSTSTDEFNFGGYANAAIDSLLEAALGVSDRDVARPMWLRMQEVLAQDPPAAYLFYPDNLVGLNLRLRGARPHLLSPINNLATWWIAPADRRYRSN